MGVSQLIDVSLSLLLPQGLFARHPAHQHPIIFLKDVSGDECEALLTYMYRGEVSVSHDQIQRILRVANSLQVKSVLYLRKVVLVLVEGMYVEEVL